MTDAALAGTATLTRFVLRRDRVRILLWVAGIVLLVVSSAASVKGLFPTQADLEKAAATTEDNAAAIVLNGPDQALDTIGGQVAFQIGSFGLIVVALMNVFTVGRITRGEEEAGRTELVRALPVGRHAPVAAALVVAAGMNAAVGVLTALGLLSQDLPVEGSLVFGASFCGLGFVFSGVAAVTAQVTENTRVVYGLSGAVLGVSFVLRAIGDVGDGTLSWLSPLGWAQKTRPYAGERWWSLLISLALAGGLVVAAVALAERRDLGAGLVEPRRGPPVAAPSLGRPLGLALRLQRGGLIWWSVGLFLLGVAYGSIAKDVEEFAADNEAITDMIARGGGDIVDSYLGTSLLMLALIGAGFAIAAAIRLRSEETSQRVEPILATSVSRSRWVASHVTVAAGGAVVVLAAAGLGTGLEYGITASDLGQAPRLVGAALLYAPAIWVLVGLTLALFGLAPRAVPVAWAALAISFVVGLLAEVFDFPAWVNDVSPFEHVPLVPAADLDVLPLVALSGVAVALGSLGLAGFRRRDVG